MVFVSRRSRRLTAPFVLALWVFAMLASMAHACGLGEGIEHASLVMPAAFGAHQGLDDETSPACDKFCADYVALLTKLKAIEDSPAGTAFLVSAPASAVPFVVPMRTSEPLSGPDPPPSLAINTRFVRLAL